MTKRANAVCLVPSCRLMLNIKPCITGWFLPFSAFISVKGFKFLFYILTAFPFFFYTAWIEITSDMPVAWPHFDSIVRFLSSSQRLENHRAGFEIVWCSGLNGKSAWRLLALTSFQLYHWHQLPPLCMQSLAWCSTSHLMESEELKSRTSKEATVSVSSIVSLSYFPPSSPPAHQLELIKACLWTNMYLSACSRFCKLNDFGEKFVRIPAKLEQIASCSQDTPWFLFILTVLWWEIDLMITQSTLILWEGMYYKSCMLCFFLTFFFFFGTCSVPNKLMCCLFFFHKNVLIVPVSYYEHALNNKMICH